MERSFIVYQGEDETPEFDLTEPTSAVHVIWEEIEAGGRAFRGESVTNSIPARDEQGETGNELNLPGGLTHISLSRGSRYEWLERVDTASPVRMAAGRIGTKDYTRGRQKASRAREVVMSNGDRNEELTEIIVDDWVRGSETDVARVLALITDYLSGTPRATTNIADTYVAAGNTITMPAKTYDGMTPKDILSEIASMANKNFFVTIDDELWYDVNTSDSYVAGVRISDRPDEVTLEGSNPGPSTVRLYPSNTSSGSGSGESDDAPALVAGVGSDSDPDWDVDGTGINYLYMYDTPASTAGGGDTGAWAVVNTGAPTKVTLGGFVHRLDGDLLSIVQNGGVIRGQHLTKSRHGIGISEAAQLNYSEFSTRVYRPGSGFVAQLTSVGDATGTVKWYANAAKGNRTFGPATTTPFPSAVEGDYLVIDYGCDHQGPLSGGTGAQVYITDTGSVDLPITDLDADSDSAKNSWWQLGPSEESLPTYPPKWDVGPASSEDGLELISGLRLYYGQEGAYVTADDPTTEAEYWHAERSFYTSDPAIDNPTDATVLAEAILQRLKFEERTYNVSIGPVQESHLGLLKPGQLIDIKARAIPDADDQFVTRRIAQLKWTTPRPGIWWARMQLDRPLKEAPYGVGPKESSTATSEHSESGRHPASNITIIDADGNFTSTDVEGALDELFDAIGTPALALDDLTDVDAPTPADGDVLTYDSGSGDWISAAPTGGGGGGGGAAELDYVQFTSPVSITGTNVAGAQTVVTGNAVAYSGDILVEFFSPSVEPGASVGAQVILFLTDGGSDIGIIAQVRTPAAGSSHIGAVYGARKITGLSSTKTYGIKAYRVTSNGTVNAGAGGSAAYVPGYIRITQIVAPALAYIRLEDQKASGTHAGTFTAGAWTARVLNTEVEDTGSHASLASNQITLAAGTYECRLRAPAGAVDNHQLRLQNVTAGTTLVLGSMEYSGNPAADFAFTTAFASGTFTVAASQALEVQHRCATTKTTNGLGTAGSWGTEVYTVAEFWKRA